MNYKLTFEDGSEAYLAHHGVKGMKWGVRNAETLARYSRGGLQAGTGNFSGGGGAVHDEEETANSAEGQSSTAAQLRSDFNRIDSASDLAKRVSESKQSDSVNYERLTQIANETHGDSGAAMYELARLVYDNTARESVEKAKTDAKSTYEKYKAVVDRSDSMSESERDAMRQEARKKKNAQKKEDANRLRRLLGLPEK